MPASTFEAFEAAARAGGFDEVLQREWQPGQQTGVHRHDFAVKAQVVRGEMWLTVGEHTRHIPAGEGFELDAGVPHAERYGDAGATFWVARRHVRAN